MQWCGLGEIIVLFWKEGGGRGGEMKNPAPVYFQISKDLNIFDM